MNDIDRNVKQYTKAVRSFLEKPTPGHRGFPKARELGLAFGQQGYFFVMTGKGLAVRARLMGEN